MPSAGRSRACPVAESLRPCRFMPCAGRPCTIPGAEVPPARPGSAMIQPASAGWEASARSAPQMPPESRHRPCSSRCRRRLRRAGAHSTAWPARGFTWTTYWPGTGIVITHPSVSSAARVCMMGSSRPALESVCATQPGRPWPQRLCPWSQRGMSMSAQSPRRSSARPMEYGSSFSRTVQVAVPDHRRLYVSGTASIDRDCRTAAEGDLPA